MKIAIANRGEVALRIHRAIKKLGHTSLLLHSEPDRASKAYRQCDERACIGPGPSLDSYLNIENVISAAKEAGADALHPGFGFLSENADFAEACKKNSIIFIGPQPESMRLFGDKISAKDFCEKNNVPTLPSYREKDQSLERLIKEAATIGYPVLIKAAAGGGGRGMRVVESEKEFEEKLSSAKNEALKAFGSDQVFLEKYLERAKHIEVQIFGSPKTTYVLGERECSVQRRHQKIIEEALSPSLSEQQREEVYSYAKTLCEMAKYQSAGTVEFLLADNKFYFLEVNTRLQVEHPVTEEIFGVDLVSAQIKNAFGEEINWKQDKLTPQGCSIECRIYAETLKGLPSIGLLGSVSFPASKNIRVELGFEKGDVISPYYDSMIAKIIATGNSREHCIKTLTSYLKESYVFGIESNIPLLLEILNHADFQNATMTTKFFEENFGQGLSLPFDEKNIYSRPYKNPSLFYKKDKSKFSSERVGDKTWFTKAGWTFAKENQGYFRVKQSSSLQRGDGSLQAPMPGQILKIFVSNGQKVLEGDSLFIVEAMKMEHTLKAPFDGEISALQIKEGDSVSSEDIILKVVKKEKT